MQSLPKVFYCEYIEKNTRRWMLTTDEELAKCTDQSYDLATLEDLQLWQAATGVIFRNIISIFAGNVKWEEKEFINRFGDKVFIGDYEFV